MDVDKLDIHKLSSIFDECRQCGTCCKHYRKILLRPEEVDRIEKLGGHVGVSLSLRDTREKPLSQIIEEEKKKGKVYMIHPDGEGCIFLEKRNNKYYCKIYHYRPEACRGFKCNLADKSVEALFLTDPTYLLGLDRFGRKMNG